MAEDANCSRNTEKNTGEKLKINISVRNIIEFTMRSGDLESGFSGSSRAVEGTRAHQKVQGSRDKEKYQSEVALTHSIEYDDFILIISGRADGVLEEEDYIVVDEIKSTNRFLAEIDEDYNPLHWGQVMVYAYFYILENDLKDIAVQLTYFQLETEEIKEFRKVYTRQELEEFFQVVLSNYFFWADFRYSWHQERNASIKNLEFPFDSYRKGQRQLAVSVYKTITDKKKLYVQAPTGIGKTISTVFPSIKALGENREGKIFYLTAKTVTRHVVEENLELLYKNSLEFKSITLTAKEKICFQEETDCSPELCPYAKGHYNRVNQALKDILQKENLIIRETVEEYARKFKVCPFEFSLDLAVWVDMVICDYNYVFDPRVGLKRFFTDDGGDYTFLIDEAHNLVDRARDMYSAELYLDDFTLLKKVLKENEELIAIGGQQSKVFYRFLSYLNRLIELLTSYRDELHSTQGYKKTTEGKTRSITFSGQDEDSIIQREEPLEYAPILNGFINRAEELLIINQKNKTKVDHFKDSFWKADMNTVDGEQTYQAEEIYELILMQYFNVISFMRIMDLYGDNFVLYYQQNEMTGNDSPVIIKDNRGFIKLSEVMEGHKDQTRFMVKLYCLDPRPQLEEILKKGKTAVFFSATLTPLTYHREILGGEEDDYILDLPSPFNSDNLCLMVAPGISTKYKRRASSYSTIADYIATAARGREGNYLVFFPSYAYLSAVYEVFIEKYPSYKIFIQSRDMNERERMVFLENFSKNDSVIGFAVLGGIFSEGVDLKGERLIGSIVVGVAHPRICLERNLIKEYFQEKSGTGYEFAYLFPGINKVLQAAGRTIRSEKDRGIVLLIGERFMTGRYQNMLPVWWNNIKKIVLTEEDILKELSEFWT